FFPFGAGIHAGIGGDDGLAGIDDLRVAALVVAAEQNLAARTVGVVRTEHAVLANSAAIGSQYDAPILVADTCGVDNATLVDGQTVQVAVGGLQTRLRRFDQAGVGDAIL